ncbi:hypothetical protein UFOVP1305_36 [uncultured Caudovirales phage]|uniref:Uncharacterized protein n=1 Tax=uncultured Caudovirales phage TaxID=2100421 RepID=A0A6J5RLJ4_9CAUD|nr:hypothetical protein UFOVP896_74 [uncultured Caudovirales phage]CAB4197839.1 hypothetical protein UFOVP1305_36 [uncultured Caudovirales phage]
MSRINERSSFDVPTRVRLLESDADQVERLLMTHIESSAERLDTLVREVRDQTDALRASIASTARMGVGILCSLVVASIMFAIQIAVR